MFCRKELPISMEIVVITISWFVHLTLDGNLWELYVMRMVRALQPRDNCDHRRGLSRLFLT